MSTRTKLTVDGNEAVAYVAYRLNEVMAIYPITPSSPMAEWCDQWASEGKKNLWGTIPRMVEMQSEGGAVGAVHGMLQTGSLSHHVHGVAGPAADDSRTCSRSPANCCRRCFTSPPAPWPPMRFRFSAITATSWPAARPVGPCWRRPVVQETMDFALISQAATLRSRIPFVHFFDGFRTSHEVSKIEMLDERGCCAR